MNVMGFYEVLFRMEKESGETGKEYHIKSVRAMHDINGDEAVKVCYYVDDDKTAHYRLYKAVTRFEVVQDS